MKTPESPLTAPPETEGCVACLAEVTKGSRSIGVLTVLSMLLDGEDDAREIYERLCEKHKSHIDRAMERVKGERS